MEFFLRIPILGKKKNANHALLAKQAMDGAAIGLEENLMPASELPSAAESLAELFGDEDEIQAEAPTAANLMTGDQITGADGQIAVETPVDILTPAAELPSAAAILAEIFPEELPAGTTVIQFPAPQAANRETKWSGSDEERGSETYRTAEFSGGHEMRASGVETPEGDTGILSDLKVRPPKPQDISVAYEATSPEGEDSELPFDFARHGGPFVPQGKQAQDEKLRPPTLPTIAEPGGASKIEADSEQVLVPPITAPEVSEAHEPSGTGLRDESGSAGRPETSAVDAPAAAPTGPARDWAFEEKLATHREWVESQGAEGKQSYWGGAKLEGAELIGVNLRYADLHDANLKAADLLLADLRDACLARANLEEACMVGTNLEGANLEGASLAGAMGIVPRQLAGTNLYQALLPEQILGFEARAEFEQASKMARRMLGVITPLCLLACLLVWKTKDAQLVADSAVLPFLHSAKAAAALPVVQLYSIVPILLMILYLVFQFHLQRLWDATLELPAVFPDGRRLGDARGKDARGSRSRVILGLLRAHFRWLDDDAPSTHTIEKALSLLVAYWIIPATLVLFWARTLTLGEMRGTMLNLALVAASTGVAFYSTTRVGRPQESWKKHPGLATRLVKKVKETKPAPLALGLAAVLAVLSIGTINGVPHDPRRATQYGAANIRRWAPSVLWAAGYDSFPDLTEAAISAAPTGWSGKDEDISSVRGAHMNGANLRYAQAYGVFLVNAHLWRADLEGASMPEADLRSADLGESNLRFADLDGARMVHANLDRARLDGSNLARADLREANMSYDSMGNAILTDARLDGATLYSAELTSATLIRATLEKTDLRGARLDGANLDDADLGQAYLWSAKLPGARLEGARLGAALAIEADFTGADFERAQFPGTVLTSARLDGANLDGADLRGAFGLTAGQVCSARTRTGALLDAALEAQVETLCGGGAAPAANAAATKTRE